MSLKVFQLAKELGVDSKVITKKCEDEGVPPPDPKKPWTHMSPVSAGLSETIREWFASGDMKTAIEQTPHIDKAKVAKPRKRSSKKAAEGEGHEGHGESSTAVAEPPVHHHEEVETESTTLAVEEAPAVVEAKAESAAPVEAPVARKEEIAEKVESPVVEETKAVAAPHAPLGTEEPAADTGAGHHPAATVEESAPPAHTGKAAAHAPSATPAKPVAPLQKPVAQVLQKPVRPPVRAMGIPNVPTRPTSVSPAGPQVRPQAATMQGPKVVRVEQPDQLPAPRARPRPPMNGPGGGNGGGGNNQNTQQGGGMGGMGPNSGPATGPTRTPGFGAPMNAAASRGKTGKEVPVDDEEAAAKKKGRPAARRGVGTGRRGDAGVAAIKEWREADLLERQGRIAGAAGVYARTQAGDDQASAESGERIRGSGGEADAY